MLPSTTGNFLLGIFVTSARSITSSFLSSSALLASSSAFLSSSSQRWHLLLDNLQLS
jgi:hypothetical protein